MTETQRTRSAGNTAYYIDPVAGDDTRPGTERPAAWKSFARLDDIVLAPGDRVDIMTPGSFDRTLVLRGHGTADNPILVNIAPGRYDFHPTNALKRAYYISNCNYNPEAGKAIGILVDNASHVTISGPGARIVYRGKMIEVCVDNSNAVTVSGLQFDYHRPTVSEFKVVAASDDSADLEIHTDSAYSIENERIVWEGEGWRYGPDTPSQLAQDLDPDSGIVKRTRDLLPGLIAEELSPGVVRVTGEHAMPKGHIFQTRQTFRDCVGVFVRRSRDVTFRDVDFLFLHGMGVLCQFTENITLDKVTIAPDPAIGRTTAAWADCFHVSGCRGKITVRDCLFSGAHDDAINVHGTYLQIAEMVSTSQVRARFMHNQTYGFLAFNPGDEIEFVHSNSLESYSSNRVTDVKMIDPKELLLTLEDPMPQDWRENDVIENVTWTPEVEVRGCTVRHIPTRGFLLTTRRRVLVTANEFVRTKMSGIEINADAQSWFESGCVRDVTISKNCFVECGSPQSLIAPQYSVPNDAFHRNIRVLDNEFALRDRCAVKASGTTGLTIAGNRMAAAEGTQQGDAFQVEDCAEVVIKDSTFVDKP